MLNPDQEERYSAEQVFRNPWSLRALKSHPELQYLAEYLKPVPSRQSSQRFSPCDLGEKTLFNLKFNRSLISETKRDEPSVLFVINIAR